MFLIQVKGDIHTATLLDGELVVDTDDVKSGKQRYRYLAFDL